MFHQNGVLVGLNTQFVVECMMPYCFNVLPVCDDALFYRVAKFEDPSFRLSFVTNIVFLAANISGGPVKMDGQPEHPDSPGRRRTYGPLVSRQQTLVQMSTVLLLQYWTV